MSHLNVLEPVPDPLGLPEEHLAVLGQGDAQREVTLLVHKLNLLNLKNKEIKITPTFSWRGRLH